MLRGHANKTGASGARTETEEMAGYRMQVQRTVRLAAVQENRHCRNRNVGDRKGKGKDLPARGMGKAIQKEIQHGIQARSQTHFFSRGWNKAARQISFPK